MMPGKRWTQQEIVEAMREWEAVFGSPPSYGDWQIGWDGEYPGTATVVRHFGTWSAAKEAAFPTPRKLRTWTREEVIAEYRRWGDEHDRLPPPDEALRTKNSLPSHSVVKRLFGSFAEARRAAGFPDMPNNVNQRAIRKFLPLRRDA